MPPRTRQTYAVPLRPGQLLPTVASRQGLRVFRDAANLPGAKTFAEPRAFGGADPSVYAYPRVTTHRNIYRIPVPVKEIPMQVNRRPALVQSKCVPWCESIRRAADRLLRRSGKTRGRDSVSRKRAARAQRSARADARSRRALLPFRRAQPDQRSESRLIAELRDISSGSASRCRFTGAIATGIRCWPIPCGRCATTGCGTRWRS